MWETELSRRPFHSGCWQTGGAWGCLGGGGCWLGPQKKAWREREYQVCVKLVEGSRVKRPHRTGDIWLVGSFSKNQSVSREMNRAYKEVSALFTGTLWSFTMHVLSFGKLTPVGCIVRLCVALFSPCSYFCHSAGHTGCEPFVFRDGFPFCCPWPPLICLVSRLLVNIYRMPGTGASSMKERL